MEFLLVLIQFKIKESAEYQYLILFSKKKKVEETNTNKIMPKIINKNNFLLKREYLCNNLNTLKNRNLMVIELVENLGLSILNNSVS